MNGDFLVKLNVEQCTTLLSVLDKARQDAAEVEAKEKASPHSHTSEGKIGRICSLLRGARECDALRQPDEGVFPYWEGGRGGVRPGRGLPREAGH